jgi:hypothetical protein
MKMERDGRLRLDDGFFNNDLLLREWLEQLSTRRAVWCWAAPSSLGESMAMWNLYAKSGVAVTTTFEDLVSALKIPNEAQVMVAKVQYHPQGHFALELVEPEFLTRPFVFKNQSYEHEQEVRIVFRIQEREGLPGVLIDVDSDRLLAHGRVVISPYMLPGEAEAFREIVRAHKPAIEIRQSTEAQESPFEVGQFAKKVLDHLDKNSEVFRAEHGLPPLLDEL